MGSLRFKLSFYAGLVVFLAVVAFALHSVSVQEKNLVQAGVRAALKDSAVIKAAIWNGMMTKDREVIREIVHAIGEHEGFKEINIYDRKGILQYTSTSSPTAILGDHLKHQENALLKDLAKNTSIRYQFLDDGNLLNVVNPLVNTPSCSTADCHASPEFEPVLGALEVKLPLQELRNQILDTASKTYIFGILLFLLVSTIIGLGVIFLVSRPLDRLNVRAAQLARGEYVPSEKPKGHDAIARLYRSFDEMSRQINERTKQLEQSRMMYKELFERVPCYLTVVDKNYRIVRANNAFTREFGDQIGQYCFVGRKGLDKKCENCQVEKTFKDGLTHRSEEVWNPGNTEKKTYVVVDTSPIFDQRGSVHEVMEMSVDITRIVNLQKELERKQEEYKNLFENVPCYLIVVDPLYRIAFYNKLFAKDFGDSWGKECFKVFKGRDTRCDNCPVEKTFLDGNSHTSEEVWRSHGEEKYIITNTSPVTDETGKIVAVLEMCTNVTELKLLQNELVILGETIAGMSHAVKNILSALEGGVYVVDSGLKAGRQDRVQLGWDMVKKNVGKVSELVKDILYASKERIPAYQDSDPAQILAEVYNLYEEKARGKNIVLEREFADNMPIATIDPKGIHTAVANLISNAIEACVQTESPRVHHIKIKACIQDSTLLIAVSDDGSGMPEEVRQNLFTKFFSTKGSKGTGLGLVVTKKIVDEHGGKIKVESELGKGTTFVLEIPLDPSQRRMISKVV